MNRSTAPCVSFPHRARSRGRMRSLHGGPMRLLRRIIVAALLGSLASFALPATAAPRQAAKAPRRVPVSAAHKKALAELYGGFKFGMTKDEVISVFSKQLDERYDDKIKATTDIAAQDRLRRDKRNEVN